MAVSNKKKRYIQRHYPKQDVKQLAQKLALKEKEVEAIIQELGYGQLQEKDKPVSLQKSLSWQLMIIIGIIVLNFLVYFPALEAGFVCDDDSLVLDNSLVVGEKPFYKIFTTEFWSTAGRRSLFYRPLVTLSYWTDYQLYHTQAFGYHLSNIIFHIFASVLLFLCLWRLGLNRFLVIATSLLFSLHPAHTQSVTWIAGRTDILATLFLLLSLSLYLWSKEKQNKVRVGLTLLALISFFLSLLSKEVAAVFPFLLISLDYIKKRSFKALFQPSALGVYFSYFLVIVIYLWLRQAVLGFAIGYERMELRIWYPADQYDFFPLITVFKIFYYYLKTLFYPVHLCFECKMLASLSWLDPVVLLSIPVVLFALGVAISILFKPTYLGLGMLWFFIALLPVANLIPAQELAMEHFLYLPSVGFCIFLGAIFENGILKLSARPNLAKKLVIGLLSLNLISYFALTIIRHSVYKDDIALWRDAIQGAPKKSRALRNLGKETFLIGDKSDALRYFLWTIKYNPQDADAHYNAGVVYMELGKNDEAIKEYQAAIQIDPKFVEAYVNLGYIFQQKGDFPRAIQKYQDALKVKPNFSRALHNLGRVYLMVENCPGAWQVFKQMGLNAPQVFVQELEQKCPR